MTIEILLAAITLIIAIVGTLLKEPSRTAKIFLIGLAVLTSLGSIIKAVNDDSDKEFMQTALISTLTPSSSSYQRLIDEVITVAAGRGFNGQQNHCIHSSDGMTCFLSSSDQNRHGTLVFNKSEVAQMYANQIGHKGPKANKKIVDGIFARSYVPKDLEEEFSEKVGVLGLHVFFTMFGHSPIDYNYDDPIGVQITFEEGGKRQTVGFSRSELEHFSENNTAHLFYDLEQKLRDKYSSAVKMSSGETQLTPK